MCFGVRSIYRNGPSACWVSLEIDCLKCDCFRIDLQLNLKISYETSWPFTPKAWGIAFNLQCLWFLCSGSLYSCHLYVASAPFLYLSSLETCDSKLCGPGVGPQLWAQAMDVYSHVPVAFCDGTSLAFLSLLSSCFVVCVLLWFSGLWCYFLTHSYVAKLGELPGPWCNNILSTIF